MVSAFSSEPYKVLLIEDTRDDERLVQRALRNSHLPLVLLVVHDGDEAVRALGLGDEAGAFRITPDLIISDLKMPKRCGDEVLTLTRRDPRFAQTPFIIFTSSDNLIERNACLALGANEYVTKPVDYDDYVAKTQGIVHRWLPTGATSLPSIACYPTIRRPAAGNPTFPCGRAAGTVG